MSAVDSERMEALQCLLDDAERVEVRVELDAPPDDVSFVASWLAPVGHPYHHCIPRVLYLLSPPAHEEKAQSMAATMRSLLFDEGRQA